MKTRLKLVAIALILVSVFAVAVEKSKPVRVSDGENNTESVVLELSEIAVLCATDEHEKFEKEWSNYVSQYELKGEELQISINWVSDEAAIHRKNNQHMYGKENEEDDDKAWKAERKKLMKEYARRAMML